MRFGNLNLYVVSDGVAWQDGGGLFGLVPKVLWQRVMTADEKNRLPVEMRCLLIQTEEQRVLVGTGYGDKLAAQERESIGLQGEGRLLSNLERLGIGPLDVDLVINTHLHADHCGGNTYYDEAQGRLVPTFPWATYCVQRLEMADASFPDERTAAVYCRENWGPVQENGQLRILEGDTRLTGEIRVTVAPGHTRAHQCVVIESGGQTALFLGGVAPWPVHMERLTWLSAWDVEPLVSIETKRRLAQWAIENHVLLLFEHHPTITAGYLYSTERPDRFRLEPIDTTD